MNMRIRIASFCGLFVVLEASSSGVFECGASLSKA
jgi:hypothetical protein